MSVSVGQRHVVDKPSTDVCYAVEKCLNLYTHTDQITANEKIFPKNKGTLATEIRDLTREVYIKVARANSIYVSRENSAESRAEERCKLQEEALKMLEDVGILIPITRKVYHLRANRIISWFGMAEDAATWVKKWHRADIEKYLKDI